MSEQTQAGPWRPSNDVELALVEALSRNDRQSFFSTVSTAPLYLPLAVSEDTVPGGNANAEDYLTFVGGGITYLLVFTSLETLQGLMAGAANGYVETTFDVLRENLAGSEVQIGLNAGTPIDAWLDAESLVRAAAGEIVVPTGQEMTELMELEDPANDEMIEAVSQEEYDTFVQDYVDELVQGDVMVITDGDFWRITSVDGVPTLEVYSTEDAVPPGTRTVTVPFLHVVAKWPAAARQLSVNPGGDMAFTLPSELLTSFGEQLGQQPRHQ